MAGDGTAFETAGSPWSTGPGKGALRRLAYFGHDIADAAVRRRVRAMLGDGLDVTGFMPRRRAEAVADWPNVDLGETSDGAFAQRLATIFGGARLAAEAPQLHQADLIVARNLDMLICAFEAKRRARLATPVIYECLDVHRLLTRRDPIGIAMRRLEGALVQRCARVWVSSPAFLDNHFAVHHRGRYRADLVENRLPVSGSIGPRPGAAPQRSLSEPLRLGWVGNLRCARSFRLLCSLADRLGERIEIHLHGKPARREIAVFEPEIDRRANMTFHGAYRAPEDLAAIYRPLDLVWAGDFMEAGANSLWLLPNRIYEGGYFAVPPVAPKGTQTAAWIEARQTGFTINEPLEETLVAFITERLGERESIRTACERLIALDESVFIEPAGEMERLVELALASEAGS